MHPILYIVLVQFVLFFSFSWCNSSYSMVVCITNDLESCTPIGWCPGWVAACTWWIGQPSEQTWRAACSSSGTAPTAPSSGSSNSDRTSSTLWSLTTFVSYHCVPFDNCQVRMVYRFRKTIVSLHVIHICNYLTVTIQYLPILHVFYALFYHQFSKMCKEYFLKFWKI